MCILKNLLRSTSTTTLKRFMLHSSARLALDGIAAAVVALLEQSPGSTYVKALAFASFISMEVPFAVAPFITRILLSLNKLNVTGSYNTRLVHTLYGLCDMLYTLSRNPSNVTVTEIQALHNTYLKWAVYSESVLSKDTQASEWVSHVCQFTLNGLARTIACLWSNQSPLSDHIKELIDYLLSDFGRVTQASAGLLLITHLILHLSKQTTDDSTATPPTEFKSDVAELREYLLECLRHCECQQLQTTILQCLHSLVCVFPKELVQRILDHCLGCTFSTLGISIQNIDSGLYFNISPKDNLSSNMFYNIYIWADTPMIGLVENDPMINNCNAIPPLSSIEEQVGNSAESVAALLRDLLYRYCISLAQVCELGWYIEVLQRNTPPDVTRIADFTRMYVSRLVIAANIKSMIQSLINTLGRVADADNYNTELLRHAERIASNFATLSIDNAALFLANAHPPLANEILAGRISISDIKPALYAVLGVLHCLAVWFSNLHPLIDLRDLVTNSKLQSRLEQLFLANPQNYNTFQDLRIPSPNSVDDGEIHSSILQQILESGLARVLALLSASYSTFAGSLRKLSAEAARTGLAELSKQAKSIRMLGFEVLTQLYTLLSRLIDCAKSTGRTCFENVALHMSDDSSIQLPSELSPNAALLEKAFQRFSMQADQCDDKYIFAAVVGVLASLTEGYYKSYDISRLVWRGLKRIFPSCSAPVATYLWKSFSVAQTNPKYGAPIDRFFALNLMYHTPVSKLHLRIADMLDVMEEMISNPEWEEHVQFQSIERSSVLSYLIIMSNACADKFGMRTESVEAINLQRRILNLIWKIFVERRADSSISSPVVTWFWKRHSAICSDIVKVISRKTASELTEYLGEAISYLDEVESIANVALTNQCVLPLDRGTLFAVKKVQAKVKEAKLTLFGDPGSVTFSYAMQAGRQKGSSTSLTNAEKAQKRHTRSSWRMSSKPWPLATAWLELDNSIANSCDGEHSTVSGMESHESVDASEEIDYGDNDDDDDDSLEGTDANVRESSFVVLQNKAL